MTLIESAIKTLERNGYTATACPTFTGSLLIQDPIKTSNNGTQYETVSIHCLDLFKFLNARS